MHAIPPRNNALEKTVLCRDFFCCSVHYNSFRHAEYYNKTRVHSTIDYVPPNDKLLGRKKSIFADWDSKLKSAREQRRCKHSRDIDKEARFVLN